MNPIVTLASLFGLMTLLSASVLYFSFKGKIDRSGRYFLGAEMLMFVTLLQVILTNLIPDLRQPGILFLGTLLLNASDLAILFSIYSLTKRIQIQVYIFSVLIAAIYCLFNEYARYRIDPNLPALLVGIPSGLIAFITYMACKNTGDQELKSNIFLKWIGYAEIILVALSLIRMLSYFFGAPVIPRDAPSSVILVYVVFACICIFRYFAYQSLRISWVSADTNAINLLNKNLGKVIREKNKLLEGLISSNRKIGISALASSLAHQLSQPITGLSFKLHTIRHDLEKIQGTKSSIQQLEKTNVELNKLSNLVNGLRGLFDHQENKFEEINLTETCDAALLLIEPALKAHNIKLIKRYTFKPKIIGNPIQLQQVLINIFNNAIDSISANKLDSKEIIFDISKGNAVVIIRIHDSGQGINPEIYEDIFELYTSTKREGLGVGLWLCKTIIDRHQGNIKAINGTDSGVTFEIALPLVNDNQIRDIA